MRVERREGRASSFARTQLPARLPAERQAPPRPASGASPQSAGLGERRWLMGYLTGESGQTRERAGVGSARAAGSAASARGAKKALDRAFEPGLARVRAAEADVRGWRSLAGAGLIAALGLACSTSPAPLRLQPGDGEVDEAYEAVLERWTRSDEIYDGLFSIMFVHATLHAPELRRAFIDTFPDAYGRGSEEARRLTLADPSAESHWELFLSASTPNQRWNDLARPDSIWRVTLQADGGPEVDAKVRRVDLNANLRTFYPYLTPFASGYGLEFPLTTLEGGPLIGPSTREIVLRVSSALGEARMTWVLDPEAPAGAP